AAATSRRSGRPTHPLAPPPVNTVRGATPLADRGAPHRSRRMTCLNLATTCQHPGTRPRRSAHQQFMKGTNKHYCTARVLGALLSRDDKNRRRDRPPPPPLPVASALGPRP